MNARCHLPDAHLEDYMCLLRTTLQSLGGSIYLKEQRTPGSLRNTPAGGTTVLVTWMEESSGAVRGFLSGMCSAEGVALTTRWGPSPSTDPVTSLAAYSNGFYQRSSPLEGKLHHPCHGRSLFKNVLAACSPETPDGDGAGRDSPCLGFLILRYPRGHNVRLGSSILLASISCFLF